MSSTPRSATSQTRRAKGLPPGLVERWRRLLRVVRLDKAPSYRPRPRVKIIIGPHIYGWVVRLALVLVALACTAQLAGYPLQWVVAIIGILIMTIRPSGVVSAVYALGLGLGLAAAGTEPLAIRGFILLLGVHLLVQLGMLASSLPLQAAVELRVLKRPLGRFLILQGSAQLLALLSGWVQTRSVTSAWVGVLAGIALAVFAWFLLSRLANTSRD